MKNRHEPDSQMNRLTEAVIGAAIEVHRELGPGFLESIYEEALCLELTERKIVFQRQSPVKVTYKGTPIGQGFIDILVENRLIVELKAVDELIPVHKAQIISYLKATGLWVGLLMNFNVPILKDGIKRIVLTNT